MNGTATFASARLTRGETASAWQAQLVRLALVVALWLLLFHRDIGDILTIWWTSDPYGHCVLLSPIIGWLVWQQRYALATLTPAAWPPALILIGACAGIWALGEAGGVALLRHAGVIGMAQGAVLVLLGRAVGRALAFPIAYGLFLIPVGSEAEPVLQILTAHMAMGWLALAQIPASLDGIFITTSGGLFRVAEACSGTGFLIAMAAYSVLVGHLCFSQWSRRIAFFVFAMTVCFIANGLRAFGIIAVAQSMGVDSAVVVDHVVYGWVFFALVIGAVMAASWRFFDRDADAPLFNPSAIQGIAAPLNPTRVPVSVLAALIFLLPVGWLALGCAASGPVPQRLMLPIINGWTPSNAPVAYPWAPHFQGATVSAQGQYRNADGAIVDLAIVAFDRQTEGRELVGFGQGAAAPDGHGDWTWASGLDGFAGAKVEALAGPERSRRIAATWYIVDGAVLDRASAVKLATIRARLLGGDQRAVAIIASAQRDDAQALRQFADSLGDPKRIADRALQSR